MDSLEMWQMSTPRSLSRQRPRMSHHPAFELRSKLFKTNTLYVYLQ